MTYVLPFFNLHNRQELLEVGAYPSSQCLGVEKRKKVNPGLFISPSKSQRIKITSHACTH